MKCGTPVRSRSLLFAALLGMALPAGASPAATAPDEVYAPARVGWSDVRMTATKLFLTAEARLSLRTVPGTSIAGDLLQVPAGQFTPLTPGADVLELVYTATGAGRQSRLTLLMDPFSGAALQRTVHDQEGRLRFRTYRFGVEGAYQRTFWPATDSEKPLLPARWTRTSEGLRPYPAGAARQAVLEPVGLLYAIAAAPLNRPGDAMDVLVFERRDTQTVRITVLPSRDITVQYDELWPRGIVQRSGTVRPLRLSLEALPAAGAKADDDGLELLGLRGSLELFLDPETRAPLQLSGTVKLLGQLTLKLAELRPR